MTDNKKLIEVALPLEAINAACKADKDRKTGTIKSVHKWFARMPAPALRALIFASLVDDPGDADVRADLHRFIERLVESGGNNPDPGVVDEARAIIEAAGYGSTPVIDPFCGGGSTIVEAQRLGLPAYGSDLNPIPVTITRTLAYFPSSVASEPALHPSSLGSTSSAAERLADDIRYYAKQVYEDAKVILEPHYPKSPSGRTPVAWRWARTVASPDPRYQGKHTPLVANWWLSKRKSDCSFISPQVESGTKVGFAIESEGTPGEPSKATCILSGAPLSFEYLREEGRHGRLQHRLIAVVSEGDRRRIYEAPDDDAERAALAVEADLPRQKLPDKALGFRVQRYGMTTWGDLFSRRQARALEVFADLVAEVRDRVAADGGSEVRADAVASFLGLCVGKMAQANSCLTRWFLDGRNGSGGVLAAFGTQTVSMSWDYVETNPFGGSVGDWMQVVTTSLRSLDHVDPSGPPAVVRQLDARNAAQAFDSSALVVTDPPYFAAVGYADLSDYFYIWVRRALRNVDPELFATVLTPKDGELIAAANRHSSAREARDYFISGFTEVFSTLSAACHPDLPISVVYAYKEQEEKGGEGSSSGWEAMLEAVLAAGLQIVGTWPIYGTGSARMRGNDSNALATYVVMVCRPRHPSAARSISSTTVATEMRQAVVAAVPSLQAASIAPVDLAQAVIGPAMSVFSTYEQVLKPDDSRMTVRDALLLVSRLLSEILDEQEGDLDAETRWAASWFEAHQFTSGLFGDADSLARSKVTSVDALVRAGIVSASAGTVALIPRGLIPDRYDPSTDRYPTVWEAVQYLVKALDTSEGAAGALLAALGPMAGPSRELGYRLFQVCERNGWAEEGQAYNRLIGSWSELVRLAAEMAPADSTSSTLF